MGDYRAKVGDVEMVSLTDGQGEGVATDVFPASAIDIWRSEYPELLDGDLIHPRFGSVALRSSGRLVVIDTGMNGPDGALLGDMAAKGIDRDAVDLVVTTHLHPDHVGWNLTNGSPTFPNARYLVPRSDWEYWTSPGVIENAPHITESVVPLDEARVLDLIDGEYDVTPELKTVPTPGHTPGHISVSISSRGQRGFVLGDVAHSPAQAHYANWSPAFDVDPDLARTTRHKVLDELEEEAVLVQSGHFPAPGYGSFVRSDGRRIWQPV